MIRNVKKEIRIIGWDDEALGRKKYISVVGAITRGGGRLDGLLKTKIERDGLDATKKISDSIINSRQYDQLRIIMLDGITFGGFNIVDIKKLNKLTKLPVIVIQRKMPNIKMFLKAIKNLNDYKERIKAVKNAGNFHTGENLIFQCVGIGVKTSKKIIKISSPNSIVPEPLRLAHIIASGLSGESKGGV